MSLFFAMTRHTTRLKTNVAGKRDRMRPPQSEAYGCICHLHLRYRPKPCLIT